MSFLNSDFPPSTNAAKADLIMYNRIVDGITDMTAALASISDQSGNISLAAAKAIQWGSVSKITWSAAKVQIDYLEVPTPFTFGDLSVGTDIVISNDLTFDGVNHKLTLSGNLVVSGVINGYGESDTIEMAQIAEPDDPENHHCVMWCSNGTGTGDVGDIMLKIQSYTVVKTKTLVNFV